MKQKLDQYFLFDDSSKHQSCSISYYIAKNFVKHTFQTIHILKSLVLPICRSTGKMPAGWGLITSMLAECKTITPGRRQAF